jgi:hypothetical protein
MMEEHAFDTKEEMLGFMQGVGYATDKLGRRDHVSLNAQGRPRDSDGKWVVYVEWGA